MPFLWLLPFIALVVIAGLRSSANEVRLREYVAQQYPELFAEVTSTPEFGLDSRRGSDFMVIPRADDLKLRELRERMHRGRLEMAIAFGLASLAMLVVFLFS